MQLDLAQLDWSVINDGVMGGCSRSAACVERDGLKFEGILSTENGGGFASIRAALPFAVPGFVGVRLSVTGDGRAYQFRLRETDNAEAVAWRATFATDRGRQQLEFSCDAFEPVVRGRVVMALPGLTERPVRFVGFMLTSTQPGPFAPTVPDLRILTRDENLA